MGKARRCTVSYVCYGGIKLIADVQYPHRSAPVCISPFLCKCTFSYETTGIMVASCALTG